MSHRRDRGEKLYEIEIGLTLKRGILLPPTRAFAGSITLRPIHLHTLTILLSWNMTPDPLVTLNVN